ncbi:hypothetical protein A9K72_31125 [Mesorhizobium loti]|nr:hypothetical protein A9174_32240 [Mesorhizobium loti NZP2037]OBP77969.1 hypothetical protein BAE41_30930 [Mesorhizobium loti]OBP96978.1 hypothetical protein BAE38_27230 [Mesorhizobium loti]OBQ73556.1 hypothetical protein A9K72_31125 [Mesorhizobium loti]
MSHSVSVIAFSHILRLTFNIQVDLDDTWYSSCVKVTTNLIQSAFAISDQEPHARLRMRSPQIPFLADDKLDMFGDEIDTATPLNQSRIGPARKTRIDFNHYWPALRPP